jgi:AcrR family transcriptional regulator
MVDTRRRQIEDVASGLFREHGYAATSVRDIARALDLQGASLYAHMASKEDVLWAIVDRAASAFEAAADHTTAGTRDDPATCLRALVRGHVLAATADPEEASVFDREWRHLARPRREEIVARRDAYEARFRAVITDGIARGVFARCDPAVAAAFVLTALNAIAVWYRPGGRLDPAALADQYADLAVRALTEASR